jgi:hypothetical protein
VPAGGVSVRRAADRRFCLRFVFRPREWALCGNIHGERPGTRTAGHDRGFRLHGARFHAIFSSVGVLDYDTKIALVVRILGGVKEQPGDNICVGLCGCRADTLPGMLARQLMCKRPPAAFWPKRFLVRFYDVVRPRTLPRRSPLSLLSV